MKMLANEEFTARKDKRKRIGVVLQICIILVIIFICSTALFTLKAYQPYTQQNTPFSGDRGFIALAYTGSENLIGVESLRQQLQALKDLGYVTISQQDIIDYYQSGKDLPEKSLFLIFEDGRKGTAISSQKILESLNFKATILTYSDKFEKKDTTFLMPEQLIELEKTTFWEMGANGHRLSYINVFDRYDNYLGELDSLQHAKVAPYLSRKYNHYLMDYLRDEYGIPKESYSKMRDRISADYQALRDNYTKSLGYVPKLYVLAHSNTGSFGNNDKVSAVNEYWIKALFTMNFNREGFCFNQRNSSLYDLTRMQPQSYWHTNHLLMRIKYDIKQDLDFLKGDLSKQASWETLRGALEVQGETLILTSLPKDKGLARLKTSDAFEDVKLSVRMKGNKIGLQRIYLRADEALNRFLSVSLFNNVLYVSEKSGSTERELYKLPLDKHDNKVRLSIPEDKKAAKIRELETSIKYADSMEKAKMHSIQLKDESQVKVPTVAEGAAEYVPELSMHAIGDRVVSLSLKQDKISITIDGKEAVNNLLVTILGTGAVYLESAWGDYGWSQRNLADDVYDGVFEKLTITENTGMGKEKILFDSSLQGFDAAAFKVKQVWEDLINWVVVNL